LTDVAHSNRHVVIKVKPIHLITLPHALLLQGRGTFNTYIWAAPPEWAADVDVDPAAVLETAVDQQSATQLPVLAGDHPSVERQVAVRSDVTGDIGITDDSTAGPNIGRIESNGTHDDVAAPVARALPDMPGRVPLVVRPLPASKHPALDAVADSQPSSPATNGKGPVPTASSEGAKAAASREHSPTVSRGAQGADIHQPQQQHVSALRRPNLAPLHIDHASHSAVPSPRGGTGLPRPSSAGVPSALMVLASAALPSQGQGSAQHSPVRGGSNAATSPSTSGSSRPGSQDHREVQVQAGGAAATGQGAGSPQRGGAGRQLLVLPSTHPLAGPPSPARGLGSGPGSGSDAGSTLLAPLRAQTPLGSRLQQVPASSEQAGTQATAAATDAPANTRQLGGSGRLRAGTAAAASEPLGQPGVGAVVWRRQSSLKSRATGNAEVPTSELYAGASPFALANYVSAQPLQHWVAGTVVPNLTHELC
jgi:hypothetical protein